MLFKTSAWNQKGKDLPIAFSKSAPGSTKTVLFSRKARNRALPGWLLTRLGWFNKGSGAVLFSDKRREKTLFSVFSVFSLPVAGRVKSDKSDQKGVKGDQKVKKSAQKRTFLRLFSRLGWFNEGSSQLPFRHFVTKRHVTFHPGINEWGRLNEKSRLRKRQKAGFPGQ